MASLPNKSFYLSFRVCCGILNIFGTLTTLAITSLYMPTTTEGYLKTLLSFCLAAMAFNETGTILAWINYKPIPSSTADADLPFVTVVIPAYNESAFIKLAMDSVTHSDYPRPKLQVVVIDDGSTDDTWECMTLAALSLNKNGIACVTRRHRVNKGKRSAVCTGFRLAKGEMIVSLDSDSILHPSAIRNLMVPLLKGDQVGGVAGHLAALNIEHKTLPRLLDVLFNTGGNIPRAAQSQAGSFVNILPGALSAFRASAVMPLLDSLCQTTFFGAPLRHGEDVELTMGLLQANWTTVYQSNAVVYTTVPETAVRTLLMYTRWERSSYVYLCIGFFRMAFERVMARLKKQPLDIGDQSHGCPESRDLSDDISVLKSQNLTQTIPLPYLLSSLYLLLNLVTTACSNPFLIILTVNLVRFTVSYPYMTPFLVGTMAIKSCLSGLLLVADAKQEDEDVKDPTVCTGLQTSTTGRKQENKELNPQSKRARLAWQLQYTGLAGLFQTVLVSWSSIIALFTLTSQSWLTR
ncbi:glycosyltransferase family 2 [Fusarium phyllophilum]|uniref:Glycosyltransferase family 2 n=1 Tax=Fusarium phyllophilum TaxID=47803 RepID=A0A8H5J0Y5_9HYPO|nr:glycosyltransferase family 2 [Fusarium phyllophilum]